MYPRSKVLKRKDKGRKRTRARKPVNLCADCGPLLRAINPTLATTPMFWPEAIAKVKKKNVQSSSLSLSSPIAWHRNGRVKNVLVLMMASPTFRWTQDKCVDVQYNTRVLPGPSRWWWLYRLQAHFKNRDNHFYRRLRFLVLLRHTLGMEVQYVCQSQASEAATSLRLCRKMYTLLHNLQGISSGVTQGVWWKNKNTLKWHEKKAWSELHKILIASCPKDNSAQTWVATLVEESNCPNILSSCPKRHSSGNHVRQPHTAASGITRKWRSKPREGETVLTPTWIIMDSHQG